MALMRLFKWFPLPIQITKKGVMERDTAVSQGYCRSCQY